MATIAEKVAAARAAGYSDADIQTKLAQTPEYQSAIAAGYAPGDVWQHLGFATPAAAAASAAPPQLFSGSDEGSRLGRAAALTGSGLVQGLGNLLGLPGDAEALINEGASKMGLPGAQPGHFLPTSSDIVGMTNSLGLTNRPDLEPQNPVEDFGEAAATGLGGGAAFGLPGVLSGIGGGIGAETAEKIAPGNQAAAIAGGLAGGLVGGGVTSTVEKLISAGDLPAAQKALEAAQSAKQELGLSQRAAQAEALTTKQSAIVAANAAADTHLAATQGPAQQTIASTAAALHPASTLQEAGTVLQQGAKDWVAKEMPQRLAAAWAPVDQLVDREAPVELNSFRSALSDINSSAGSLEPLAAKLKPGAPAGIKSALEEVDKATGEGMVNPPSWGDAQRLRSTLGDALSNPKVVNDVGEQNLRRMYATLTKDMRSTAAGQGQDALAAFDSANEQSSQIYKLAEGPISKILNNDPNPEAVAKSLASGGKAGATDLAALRQELPEGTNALAATLVKQGQWTGLAPEAKAALVPDATLRGTLAAAHEASASGASAAQQLRTTGIAAARQSYDDLRAQHAAEMLAADTDRVRAGQTLAVAKAAHPPVLRTGGSHIFGGLLGEQLGEQAGHLLSGAFSLPESAGPTLAFAGAALPMAVAGARAAIRNPRLLLAPTIGVTAGNALALRQGQ